MRDLWRVKQYKIAVKTYILVDKNPEDFYNYYSMFKIGVEFYEISNFMGRRKGRQNSHDE